MFNKRESNEAEARSIEPHAAATRSSPGPASGTRGALATIGASITIQGELRGEEDLVVEGKFKGQLELKKNTLTIGQQGSIDADVFAHTIFVDGTVNGNLFASERISIRKTARITGNLYAPRISLEDGARFRGSIDMDSENEAFRKAFGAPASPIKPAAAPERPVEASKAALSAKPGSGTHG